MFGTAPLSLPPSAWRFAGLALAVGALAAALALPVAGLAGAAMALAFMVAVAILGAPRLAAFHPHARLGPANAITTARAGVGALAAAVLALPGGLADAPALAWALTGAVVAALALDGVDGWLARRTGLASRFGARLDMEVDAALGALLALLALLSGKAGPWVLALGFLRYGFVAAGVFMPWLTAPLLESGRRKAVCVVQIAVLAALLAPVIQPPASTWLALAGTLLLAWSFAVDIRWLWRAR